MSGLFGQWFGGGGSAESSPSDRANQQQQGTLRRIQALQSRIHMLDAQIGQIDARVRAMQRDGSKTEAQRKEAMRQLLRDKQRLMQQRTQLEKMKAPLEVQQTGISSTVDAVDTLRLLQEGTEVQNDLMETVGGSQAADRVFVRAQTSLERTAGLTETLMQGFDPETEPAIYGQTTAEADDAIERELDALVTEDIDNVMGGAPAVPVEPLLPRVVVSDRPAGTSLLLEQMMNTRM
jgi:chromosome segregation ATPase